MAHKLRISDSSNRGIGDMSSSPRLLMSSIPGPLPSSPAEESRIKPPRKKNFFKSLWKGLKSEAHQSKAPPKVSSFPNLNKQISSAPPLEKVPYSEDALARKIARLEAERKQEKDAISCSTPPKQQYQSTRIATACPPRGGTSKVEKEVDNTRYAVVQMVVREADDDAVARKIAENDNPSTQETKPTTTRPPQGGQQPSKVVDATVDNTRYAVVQMVLQEAGGEDDKVARKIAQHDNSNPSSSLKRALTSDGVTRRTKATGTRTSGGKSSLRRALTADAAAPSRRTTATGSIGRAERNSGRKRGDTRNPSTTYPVPPTIAQEATKLSSPPNHHQSTLRRARTSDSALSSRARNVARGGLSSLRRALTAEGTTATRRNRERSDPNKPKQQSTSTGPHGSKVDDTKIDTARYTVVQMVVQQADNDAVATKVSQQQHSPSTLRNSDRAPSTRAARNVRGLSSLRRALTDTAVGKRQPKTTRNIRRGESERSFPKKTKTEEGDLDWENVESALLPPNDGKKDEKTLANSKPAGNGSPHQRVAVAAPGRTSPPPTKTLSFWPGAKPEEARAELDDSGNATPPLPQPQLRPGAFSMVPSFVSSDPAQPQEEIPPELLQPEMDESLVAETDLARARTSTSTTALPQAQPVTESDYESYSQLKQLQNEYANHEAQMAEMQKRLEEMQRVQQELDRLKEELPQAEMVNKDEDKKKPQQKKNKPKKKEKAVAQPVLERPKNMTDGEWGAYQYLVGL